MTLVKCAWCDGTGIDGPGESPCDVCGGDGSVNAPEPLTSCKRCSGKGRIFNEIIEEYGMCGGCSGTGWSS